MDALQEWPEPIIRVQSLADSGASLVPNRYIRPSWERPSESRLPPSGDVNIPIIDLGGLFSDKEAEKQAVMDQIYKACSEWGLFEAVNHGVSLDLMRKTREVWREFFHLPLEEKQVYGNSPKTYEGYGSRLGVEKGAILDWGDYFFLHVLPMTSRDHSKWPAVPTSCRDLIEECSAQLMNLFGSLMKVLSLNLGLKEDYLLNAFGREDIEACMRANIYPRCPQPQLTLGLSPHSDPGILTLLLPDDRVDGLQIRKDDAWLTVRVAPESIIVNIADQIQIVSNTIYKSVEHRVIANSIEERISIALFLNPRSDTVIGPAEELITSEKTAMYAPMSFDQYRLGIRTRGPQGKSLVVESLRSEKPK